MEPSATEDRYLGFFLCVRRGVRRGGMTSDHSKHTLRYLVCACWASDPAHQLPPCSQISLLLPQAWLPHSSEAKDSVFLFLQHWTAPCVSPQGLGLAVVLEGSNSSEAPSGLKKGIIFLIPGHHCCEPLQSLVCGGPVESSPRTVPTLAQHEQ